MGPFKIFEICFNIFKSMISIKTIFVYLTMMEWQYHDICRLQILFSKKKYLNQCMAQYRKSAQIMWEQNTFQNRES